MIPTVTRTVSRAGRGKVVRWNKDGWVQATQVPTAKDSPPAAIHRATTSLLARLRVQQKDQGTLDFL